MREVLWGSFGKTKDKTMIYKEGSFYHIYNRGCNKEKIFFCSENYKYLIRRMKKSYKKYSINIIAFCLMPNHYHFLLQQESETPLSEWLRTLFSGYTLAVNKQQNRIGTLFEGKPKKKVIDKEEYLQHLVWYIHYNPVKAGLVSTPDKLEFSNYLECIGKRKIYPYDSNLINSLFGSKGGYKIFAENYFVDRRIMKKLEKYLFD